MSVHHWSNISRSFWGDYHAMAEAHVDALCHIEFQRTLRIPDDNREHYLPPGLGRFSMLQVDDYSGKVTDAWRSHGGVFLPMHQADDDLRSTSYLCNMDSLEAIGVAVYA